MSPPFFIIELYPAPEPYASKVFSCARRLSISTFCIEKRVGM
jgi:hypothetical protein